MPIKAKCRSCGKVITVKDEAAGKKAKCRECGHIIDIPARQARPPHDDAADDVPDSAGPARPRRTAIMLLFGGAIVLMLLAAFAPLFAWIAIFVSEGEGDAKKNVGTIAISGMGTMGLRLEKGGIMKTAELSSGTRPEGRLMLGFGIAASVLLAAGLVLALSGLLEWKKAELFLNVTLLGGLGSGIVLIVWNLAWVWKMLTLAQRMQQGLAEVKTGLRATNFTYQPFPGIGYFVALLASLFIAYCFSQAATRLSKQRKEMFRAEQLRGVSRQAVERLSMSRKHLLIAEVAGLLLGGLILALVVQPWKADDLWTGIEPLAVEFARPALAPDR